MSTGDHEELTPRFDVEGVGPRSDGQVPEVVGADLPVDDADPGRPSDLPEGYELVPDSELADVHRGRTARTALRVGAVVLAAAVAAGGVGAGLYYGLKTWGPHTTTTITIKEADGVLDNVSLIDETHVARAHGHSTVSLDASTKTRVLSIPFTNFHVDTPAYAHEHAGGTETGSVDAVLKRANAVELAAAKDEHGNLFVEATVDVTGLGIEGVDDFWTADGKEQDGISVQFLNAVGISSDREGRLNAAEAIALDDLEASAVNTLGDKDVMAAAIAGQIRQGILNPSAELLSKVGPGGAKILEEMGGQPLRVRFVTYPENAKPINAGKPLVFGGSNVLPGPTPVASSDKKVTLNPMVGPSSTIDLSTRAVTPESALLTINASRQVGNIVKLVQRAGEWFVVAAPSKPQSAAAPSASTAG